MPSKKKAKAKPAKAVKAKPVAKKAAKKAAAKKAAPAKKPTKRAPLKLTEYYDVRFYNTLLDFEQRVCIGHPPEVGDVLYVHQRPYKEKLRGVVVKTSPVECLLDPTKNTKGSVIL